MMKLFHEKVLILIVLSTASAVLGAGRNRACIERCINGYKCKNGQCISICGPNSHIATCVSVCPQTCQSLSRFRCEAIRCDVNLCACDSGYVFIDGGDHSRGCVPPQKCNR